MLKRAESHRCEVKGSLFPLKNENKFDEDFYCTLHKLCLFALSKEIKVIETQ